MTRLADLLSPEQIEAVEAVRIATKAAPTPVDLPPVTTVNGVDLDLRSEGLYETACADCTTPLLVEVAPKGADLALLVSHPRIAVCEVCGQIRLRGRRGTLIHTTTPTTTKENELDLTKFSNAELAALAVEARERMVAEAAEALPAKRDKAKQVEAEREAVDDTLKAQDRAKDGERKVWMGGFTIYANVGPALFERHGPKDVPGLDFTEVNLDELVPAKVRSPYNKVLHLLSEPLLWDQTTFRVLRKVHKRLWKRADVAYEASKTERLVAEIDPEAKAKVEAFAKVTGKTFEEAREHLVGVGLL